MVEAIVNAIDKFSWDNIENQAIQLCARSLNEYVLKLMNIFYSSKFENRRLASLAFFKTHVSEQVFHDASVPVLFQILSFYLQSEELTDMTMFSTVSMHKLAHILLVELDRSGSFCDRLKVLYTTVEPYAQICSGADLENVLIPTLLMSEKLQEFDNINKLMPSVTTKLTHTALLNILSTAILRTKLQSGSTVLVPLITMCLEKALIDHTDPSPGRYYGESVKKNASMSQLLNQCISLVTVIQDSELKDKTSDTLMNLLVQYIDKFIGNPHIILVFLDSSYAVNRIKNGNKPMINLLLTSYKKLNTDNYFSPQLALKAVFYKLFSIKKESVRNDSLTNVANYAQNCTVSYLKTLLSDPQIIQSIQSGSPLQLLCERYLALMSTTISTKPPDPAHSWRMPAEVPRHPKVEEFLRGDLQSATIYGEFDGINHARNFISRVVNDLNRTGLVSVHGSSSGTGRNACCTLTKTRAAFENRCNLHKLSIAERTRIQELLATARSMSSSQKPSIKSENSSSAEPSVSLTFSSSSSSDTNTALVQVS